MHYTIEDLETNDVYKLISNLVVPRPIAWVSTLSDKDILNLAPFSYFIPLSSSPATLLISIGHKSDGSEKDTLKNLRDTKKCSIVIAQPSDLKELDESAAPLEYNRSEYSALHIDSKVLNPDYPAVPKSAQIVLFCEYLKEVELDGSATIPVIVEVKKVYINNALVEDSDNLKIALNRPILARVGRSYFELGDELLDEKDTKKYE